MSLLSNLESILFVAGKPLSLVKLAIALAAEPVMVEETIEILKAKYNHNDSGIHIIVDNGLVQLCTNPQNGEAIRTFLKEEIAGELTKAQLETLTVIAYRGPVGRLEIEQIRGVNCALILRNLMVRGLVEERAENSSSLVPLYVLSFDALGHLGLRSPTELPDYESLHKHEHIETALQNLYEE